MKADMQSVLNPVAGLYRRKARSLVGSRSLAGCLATVLLAVFSLPAMAQVDIANMWRPLPHNQDGSGMIGDAAGVPISQDGSWRAQSWSAEEYDVAEWVCRPHAWDYSLEGPLAQVRFATEYDQATQDIAAYRGHIYMQWQQQTIWMDGRPHPPKNAPHTWSGFTTGRWDGDVLVTTTTHLKEAYIRRWGLMRSDQTTVTTRWRRFGDYLQATVIMYDPVYLTAPYSRSSLIWIKDPGLGMDPYPCEEATETAVPKGSVAHFLPGESYMPAYDPERSDPFGTPYETRLGGAETMYPEYIDRMATMETSSAPPDPADVRTGN